MTSILDLTSNELRVEIEALYNMPEYLTDSDDFFSKELKRLAQKYSVSTELAEQYWSRLETVHNPVDSVTIFVHETEWFSDAPCTDSRYGTQLIPRGCWGIGFATPGKMAVLHVPHLADAQQEGFLETLVGALLRVGEMNAEAKAQELIQNGFVALEVYKGAKTL